jgi:hypothetical protein
MRRVLLTTVVVLIYTMTPSAGEIAESVVHLVTEGHTAHAVEDDAHQPEGAEHGCSGPFHVCSCHSTTAFTAAFAAADLGAPVLKETELGWWYEDAPPERYLESVFRPPIA